MGLKIIFFLIHGSIGTSSLKFEKETVSPQLTGMVEKTREKNGFARVIIFSGASTFPLKKIITDIQADGYLSDVLTLDEFSSLASRGEITPEEIIERGCSIENISTRLREMGETAYYRNSKETSD